MKVKITVLAILTMFLLFVTSTLVMADARAEYEKGYDLFKNKNFKGAIAQFDKAIKENKGYVKAYTFRGFSYFLLEKYNQAIKDLNTAIELDPENSTALFYRGQTYFFLGHSKKAVEDYDRVLKKQPENYYTLFMKGVSSLRLGDYAAAIHSASDTISYSPKSGDAYILRGYAYLLKKDYNYAMTDFNKAADLNPTDPFFKVFKLVGLARSGKDIKAEAEAFYIKGKDNKWPYLGAGLLIDKVTPQDCLDAATAAATNDNDKKVKEQQANFVVSQYYFIKKDSKKANDYLAKSMGDQCPLFLVQGMVKEDLKVMKGK